MNILINSIDKNCYKNICIPKMEYLCIDFAC